jgi:hypothetical protein
MVGCVAKTHASVDGRPVRRSVPGPTRSCENRGIHGISEVHPMDKKAKTPKKPKQTKTKDGAAKGK